MQVNGTLHLPSCLHSVYCKRAGAAAPPPHNIDMTFFTIPQTNDSDIVRNEDQTSGTVQNKFNKINRELEESNH